MNVVRLFARLSKWESLVFLIEALPLASTTVKELILESIDLWLEQYNRAFIEPSTELMLRLKQNLVQRSDILGERSPQIQAVLKVYDDASEPA